MIGFVPANIILLPYESEVKNGLSVTPAQMDTMTLTNKAVCQHQLDGMMYTDGTVSPSDLPLVYRRGVDFNTTWEYSQKLGQKLRDLKRSQNLRQLATADAVSQEGGA